MHSRTSRGRATIGVVLLLIASTVGPAPAVNAAYSAKILPVTHFQQNKSNWCWAAAAKVVINYKTGSTVSQCKLVDSQWTLPTGCPNNGGSPSMVKNIVNSYMSSQNKGGDWDAGWATVSQLMGEINSDEPIIADVKWKSNGGQHMFTVYGYDTGSAGSHVYVSNYSGPVGTGKTAKKEVHSLASFADNTKHKVLRWMRIVSV